MRGRAEAASQEGSIATYLKRLSPQRSRRTQRKTITIHKDGQERQDLKADDERPKFNREF